MVVQSLNIPLNMELDVVSLGLKAQIHGPGLAYGVFFMEHICSHGCLFLQPQRTRMSDTNKCQSELQ